MAAKKDTRSLKEKVGDLVTQVEELRVEAFDAGDEHHEAVLKQVRQTLTAHDKVQTSPTLSPPTPAEREQYLEQFGAAR